MVFYMFLPENKPLVVSGKNICCIHFLLITENTFMYYYNSKNASGEKVQGKYIVAALVLDDNTVGTRCCLQISYSYT